MPTRPANTKGRPGNPGKFVLKSQHVSVRSRPPRILRNADRKFKASLLAKIALGSKSTRDYLAREMLR